VAPPVKAPGPVTITDFASPDLVAAAAAQLFASEAAAAVAARGVFRVALSGGTTPLLAYRLLADPARPYAVDWPNVQVFFGDERCVPPGHPDRNDRAADEALLGRVPVPEAHVHRVEVLARNASERYEAELRRVFGVPEGEVPRFDLILLGMGPDGHTASLFPGHAALAETKRLVVRIAGSPMPPPERVTFTLPLINAARAVAFLVTGAEKREAFLRAVGGDRSVPAGCVLPRDGALHFLVDQAVLPPGRVERVP
jgi:6-phosphogluconolactonase